jgi:hypothetical protein
MARRPTKIDRLPKELREAIGQLFDSGHTTDEILAHVRMLGAPVSRSSLGRYLQRQGKLGERLRQSRSMAEGLARELGDKPGDQVARVNIELLHSFLSDAFASADAGDDEDGLAMRKAVQNPMGAKLFAEAVERLTKASRHNQEFVAAIEKRAADRAQRAAADRVEAVVKSAPGMTAQLRDTIIGTILGVAPAGSADGARGAS